MVREGFPVQAQLKTASEPRSTSRDWGSDVIRGPTVTGEGQTGAVGQGLWGPLCGYLPFPTRCLGHLRVHQPCPHTSVLCPWARGRDKGKARPPGQTAQPRKEAPAPFVPGCAPRPLPSSSLCPGPRKTPSQGVGRGAFLLGPKDLHVSALQSSGCCSEPPGPPRDSELWNGVARQLAGIPTSAVRLSSVPAPSSILFEPAYCPRPCYLVGLMEAPLCTPFPKLLQTKPGPRVRTTVNS